MGYFRNGTYVGRIWSKKNNGPSVVKIIDNEIYDITTKEIPTVSSLLELENPIDYIKKNSGNKVTSIDEINSNIDKKNFNTEIRLLAPCDLQVVKACGVTFAKSMVERLSLIHISSPRDQRGSRMPSSA